MDYPYICEARDLLPGGQYESAPWSQETIIETASGSRLVSISEGYTIAGSANRWQSAGYGVRWEMDGAMHGRQYRALEEAREFYARRIAFEAQCAAYRATLAQQVAS